MLRRPPQTATEWAVRLNAGPLSPSDQRALTHWLSAHSSNQKDLEAAQAAGRLAQGLADSQVARAYLEADYRSFLETEGPQKTTAHRFALPSFAALAVAAGVALFVFAPQETSNLPRLENNTSASTSIGEISTYLLPDRSQITVAADSSISVDFVRDQREMSLERGEAFFEVEPDRTRPFVIRVGQRTVTVTGTKFNVNYYADRNDMEVAVVEGRINVGFRGTQSGRDEVMQVGAGQVVLFPADGPPVYRSLTADQAAAWRTRSLYFDGANLSQVLTSVNRYAVKPLIMDKTESDHLLLTGQFPAGDIKSVLISLHQLYGIEARESGDRWLLTPKSGTNSTQ